MRFQILWLQCLIAWTARAQQNTDSSSSTQPASSSASDTQTSSEATSFAFTNSFSVIGSTVAQTDFTDSRYTYAADTRQVTATSAVNSNNATSASVTQLVHTTQQSNATDASSSQTASTTSSAPAATNTVPCNNYPEFCSRKYSNITEVCAHNSAFSIKGNAASNQVLSVLDQLNDGVRMSMPPDIAPQKQVLTFSSSG